MDLSLLLSDSKPLEIFKKDKREGELSHAYALFGEDVFAMEWLLREMAKTAVCPVGGCGKCAACTALDGGVHPDVKFYSDRLDVRDVNELLEDCAKYSVEGGLKVYVVFQLDKTLAPAQNKLLKTVEEPPEGVLFLFGIVKPNAVAETLRSRCKKLYYTGVEQSRLEEALERECGENENSRRAAAYAGGNISRALKFAQDAEFARDADDIIALLGSSGHYGDSAGYDGKIQAQAYARRRRHSAHRAVFFLCRIGTMRVSGQRLPQEVGEQLRSFRRAGHAFIRNFGGQI